MIDKIVCVDDDSIALMLCKKIIAKIEFAKEILTFENGEQAIEYFDELYIKSKSENVNYPKLIILDLNMPIMDGWQFLEEFMIKEYQLFFDLKVIILSSTIDPDDINRSKTFPMVLGFSSKPITKEILEDLKKKL